MRRTVEGLRTPYPLVGFVPAFMQEDDLLVRLTSGLDEVLAPVVSVLDCLDSYVDPMLAPSDFLDWLGDWVGAPLDDNWSDSRRRRAVLSAATLHALRGTVPGLRRLVELATGGEVMLAEPGGISISHQPTSEADAPMESHEIVVRVAVDDPAQIRLSALDELV